MRRQGKSPIVSCSAKLSWFVPSPGPCITKRTAGLPETEKTKDIYLPKGAGWFNFWTNAFHAGGQTIRCDAPLDVIPLFVRTGSIIPISEPITYADEKKGEVSEILVYGGEDGEFVLYNDEGDSYAYENGRFSAIHLKYSDHEKNLHLRKGTVIFKYRKHFRDQMDRCGTNQGVEAVYREMEQNRRAVTPSRISS